MRSRVTQGTQSIQRCHCLFGCGGTFTLHALGFVHDDYRVGLLDQMDRTHSVKFVDGPVDDIGLVLFLRVVKTFAEGGDVDNHDGDVVVDGKGAHVLRLAAVVDVGVVDHIVVDGPEVFPGNLQGLGHAFFDGNAGHHDDELLEAVRFVQLKDGTQVDISLAGAGLHLNIKIVNVLFQRLGLRQAVAQLNRLEVFQNFFRPQFQLIGYAVIRGHLSCVILRGDGKTAPLGRLATKEVYHSGNCLLLVVEVGVKL